MKISRIRIENFRSIKFAEFVTDDFNIFVGQNNCGKTNFFEAIEFFFNGLGKGSNINDLKFGRDDKLEMVVEVEFFGVQHGIDRMQNERNETKIRKLLADSDCVTISRSSSSPKKRVFIVDGSEINPGTGFDSALNDFLPKFEYISTKKYYDSVAKYAKSTPIGIMLSGVLTTILEGNEQYQQFQQHFRDLFEDENSEIKREFDVVGGKVKVNLQKQFPDTANVTFEVRPPVFDDLLKSFDTTIDDGIETTAEEKGDGMQRALMLAIIQTYAEFRKEKDEEGKSFLFFIDEAELHLHPSAQRNLKAVLQELSADSDQVFINTHSSVFVADECDGQSLYKVEKNDKETAIELVDQLDKPYIIYDLLGGSPADLLLPQNFLIVEGVSEFEFISRVLKRFYSDKPPIQIITANGDIDQTERTINAIERAFAPLNKSIYRDRLVILFDKPSDQARGGVEDFLKRHRNLTQANQVYRLPFRDIEQYYPNYCDNDGINWQKTQAELDVENDQGKRLFNGRKKRQLAKRVGGNITEKQFRTEMPIVFSALEKAWELAY